METFCPPTNVSVIKSNDGITEGRSSYLNNQSPLHALKLLKLPLGAVKPHGWIRHQLDLMTEGMVGRLDEISSHLSQDNGWFIDGSIGWEEQPYWLRGYYALGALTGDARIQKVSRNWIEKVIASQKPDGWFGSTYHQRRPGTRGRKIDDLWPHMVMIDALRQHYELTEDKRVPEMVSRFFSYCRNIPDEEFIPRVPGDQWSDYREDFGDWKVGVQIKRAGEMLPHLYWLYNLTGNDSLLALATRFYQRILPPVSEFLDVHVVNFVQRYAYPGLYGQQANLDYGLAESEYWYRQHMSVWGQQPRGAFGADEMIRSGKVDPRQGMETCAIIEFVLKFYELGRITGDPLYADRVEDLMFNHFPASQTADLKALHYLTASNLPQCDCGSGHDLRNEEAARELGQENPMLVFSPHRHRCCQHNVAMGWPFYAQNLWQATSDGGIAAWLYGASKVDALVSCGPIRFTQETDYPFSGKVVFQLEAGNGQFPLYLRWPGWCKTASLSINDQNYQLTKEGGHYIRIERNWTPGDRVTLVFAMDVSSTRWPRSGALTIDRGPLSYSVRIEEDWRRSGGTEQWPEWEAFPASPWNYGLELDAFGNPILQGIEESDSIADQPWSVEQAPIEMKFKARKIPEWKLEDGGSVQELRKSPIKSDYPVETIRFIPMGCARLRMTCLPVIDKSSEAQVWGEYRNC